MANDTGIGNINFGSAASQLIAYLNNPDYRDKDPLNLRRYLLNEKADGRVTENDIDFDQLYRDLNDLESPTTAAIAILNGAKGYNAYGAMFGPAFLSLGNGTLADRQRQAALISTFYKSGSPGLFPDDSGEQRLPSQSQLPDIDQINRTAGGAYGLGNYGYIDGLLGGGPGKLGESSAMNGIINKAMTPGIGDRAAAAPQLPGGTPATITGPRLGSSNDPRRGPQVATPTNVGVDQPSQTALPRALGAIASGRRTVDAAQLGRAVAPLSASLLKPFATSGYDTMPQNSAAYPGAEPGVLSGSGILSGIQLGPAHDGDPAALSPWDQVIRGMLARRNAGL